MLAHARPTSRRSGRGRGDRVVLRISYVGPLMRQISARARIASELQREFDRHPGLGDGPAHQIELVANRLPVTLQSADLRV